MHDSLALLLHRLFILSHLSALKGAWQWWGNKRERTADRFAPGTVTEAARHLIRGDVLEVERTLFVHSGIYLGQELVAHLIPDVCPSLGGAHGPPVTNTRLIVGCVLRRASVRVDSVSDFAYGARLHVNELDGRVGALAIDGERVARRAERLVGPPVRYSLLWNNCEHFVTFCRYGNAASLQTDRFCSSLKMIIRDQRSVIFVALLGLISIIWFGLRPSTALPTILIPFILWMAG